LRNTKDIRPSVALSSVLTNHFSTLTFEQAITGPYQIIDVRSPKEYLEGSLPGAVNIPVFDDEERHVVGLVYRNGGRDEAIETGFNLVEQRLTGLLAGFEEFRGENIAVFCARGGMRSRSVVNLLLQQGIAAWQLQGGYKEYRRCLLGMLSDFSPECIVLHGHTGTGKTRILQHLLNMIDLEDLAQHQSSLFGGLNRFPRTQKDFDSHLHKIITHLGEAPYFIEGESRKLGGIYLPAGLFRAMKEGHLVLITASIEKRVERIVEDYPVEDDATAERVLAVLRSLRSKLGTDVTEKLCSLLRRREFSELVYILLIEYYDKRYNNSFRKYQFEVEISSEDIRHAADELTGFRQHLLRARQDGKS
jgi:tRNA 2-selenouridine synthase